MVSSLQYLKRRRCTSAVVAKTIRTSLYVSVESTPPPNNLFVS